MIERNSYTKVQKFIFPPRWNFVRNLLFREGSQCQSGLVISKDQHTPRIMQPLRPFPGLSPRRLGFGQLRLSPARRSASATVPPRPLQPPCSNNTMHTEEGKLLYAELEVKLHLWRTGRGLCCGQLL